MRRGYVYLAARYSRREELCAYRDVLEQHGFVVTSRWLNGQHPLADEGTADSLVLSEEASLEERARFAQEDWYDVIRADWHINFTEPPRSPHSRGGRHVELGGALATMKRVIVIGPAENVFHCLPQVVHFATWEAFVETLK